MKRRFTLLVIYLALAVQGLALEPKAPPSPPAHDSAPTGKIRDSDGVSFFVGHYGEVLEIPYGWTAEAEMREKTEAVFIHRKSHDDFGYQPFQPKKSDYKPENFSPMGLIELVVSPKNAPGGLGSLDAIRRAKELHLKQQGVEFRIFEESYGIDWPLGTFHIVTKRPYRLRQTYTQSAEEFFFLTKGDGLAAGEFGLSESRVLDYSHANLLVSRSLASSLLAMPRRTVIEKLFERVAATPDFREDMRPARIAGILGLFIAPMLILAFWRGESQFGRRARLYGRSLLLFSLSSAFLGFLVVYVPARAAGLVWRRPTDAWVAVEVWMPLIAWVAAVFLGSSRKKRILSVTCALVAAWCALLIFGSQSSTYTSASELLAVNILAAFLTGIVLATGFTLAFGKPAAGPKESR